MVRTKIRVPVVGCQLSVSHFRQVHSSMEQLPNMMDALCALGLDLGQHTRSHLNSHGTYNKYGISVYFGKICTLQSAQRYREHARPGQNHTGIGEMTRLSYHFKCCQSIPTHSFKTGYTCVHLFDNCVHVFKPCMSILIRGKMASQHGPGTAVISHHPTIQGVE